MFNCIGFGLFKIVHTCILLQVFGTETTDQYRPSAAPADCTLEQKKEDQEHKGLLVALKVRDYIRCAECLKPRCIFAAKKLSYEQVQDPIV